METVDNIVLTEIQSNGTLCLSARPVAVLNVLFMIHFNFKDLKIPTKKLTREITHSDKLGEYAVVAV